ncbi:MAG TPA: guanosine-3',5'-bis(diphosphate) 3'-pyrophosphohydrolase, partial [Thermoleophilia bacterium]|nr:guanosine-3',5'-bis(diphosphate) 3'-pyrophosphohydrolase [Thermoleophilia bacterium]
HQMAVHDLLPVGVDDAVRHAALLHDVIEDTDETAESLLAMGYSERTVKIVSLVSRDKSDGKTYHEFIESIAESDETGAILVKLADLAHNSDPERLAQLPPDKAAGLGKRYAKATTTLTAALVRLS